MKVFDREMDNLEENIIYLALAFFVSMSFVILFGRLIPFVALLSGFAASLCFIAGSVAILLWVLRCLGSPLYARFARPERNKLQSLLTDRDQLQSSDEGR
jgi:hypothetical protein